MHVRAGFVGFTFPDYPQDTLNVIKKQFEEAKNTVVNLGIEVVCAGLVYRSEDISRVVTDLMGKDFDFIIALIPSVTPPPFAVNTLKPFFHKPILLWGLPSYKQGDLTISAAGAAGVAALRYPLSVMGAKLKMIFGSAVSREIKENIELFARVAKTMRRLSESKIGIIGYADQGGYTYAFDQTSLRQKIGPEVEDYGLYPLIIQTERIEKENVKKTLVKLKEEWEIDEGITDENVEKAARIYLALRKAASERGYHAMSMRCLYGLPRYYGMTPCIPLSLLGDEMPTMCESDVLGLVTELILHYLTGKVAAFLEFFDFQHDRVLMGACGLAPPKLIEGKPKMHKYAWGEFVGLMSASPMKVGRVTLARLASVGDRYLMHITSGEAVTPKQWREIGWLITAPQYPSLEIILGEETVNFVNNVVSPHYHMVYGDHREELKEFCKLLNIQVIE